MSLRPSQKTEARRQNYKIAVDADGARRKRQDNLVEIRKSKREESLLKKRRDVSGDSLHHGSSAPVEAQDSTRDRKVCQVENLAMLAAGVWSNESEKQLEATIEIQRLLSIEKNPPIQEVIDSGVVPALVQFLTRSDLPKLQFEAAWALTNIASGSSDQTRVVVDHGVIPLLVQLLASPVDDVREQAVWALGNIAGDSPNYRDLVLSHGAMASLLKDWGPSTRLSLLRNITWTLSNFCRGKPAPPLDQTRAALPALAVLLQSDDDEILTDSSWALSYLSDGPNERIQAVIAAGVCPRLVTLLLHPSATVVIPALRTVGNVVTGDETETQFMIDCHALPSILPLLSQKHRKSIKKEACWTISNITAGTVPQIQAVIDANIIPPLLELLVNAEFDVKKEAAWAISNATSGGTPDQIKYLVRQGCIKPMCDLLECSDTRIISVCLEGLENILRVGEAERDAGNSGGVNLFAQYVEEAEGLDKIETLQSHDNTEIYESAVRLLESYWQGEEEDEVVAPSTSTFQPSPAAFSFGAQGQGPQAIPIGGFSF